MCPYIKSDDDRREKLKKASIALNAGELNYQIFTYILKCIDSKVAINKEWISTYVNNFLGDRPNYQKYNDITGCLVCCYNELYRRFNIEVDILSDILDSYDNEIGIYEELKIIENGDV